MKGVKSYSRLYGEDSANQSSRKEGPPVNMKILISLVRPLKCRISASVGLWNEGMTNRLTVEGSQKLFPVIWGRFCRPVVQGRGLLCTSGIRGEWKRRQYLAILYIDFSTYRGSREEGESGSTVTLHLFTIHTYIYNIPSPDLSLRSLITRPHPRLQPIRRSPDIPIHWLLQSIFVLRLLFCGARLNTH